jgi:hypothetical protein
MLLLDGIYIQSAEGELRFRQVTPPTNAKLQALLHRITHRVARHLERQGLLERDVENSYLSLEGYRPRQIRTATRNWQMRRAFPCMQVWPRGRTRTDSTDEDPDVIERILNHLDQTSAGDQHHVNHPGRGPPQRDFFA